MGVRTKDLFLNTVSGSKQTNVTRWCFEAVLHHLIIKSTFMESVPTGLKNHTKQNNERVVMGSKRDEL